MFMRSVAACVARGNRYGLDTSTRIPNMRKPTDDSDEWQVVWDARLKGLSQVLGKPQDKVYHAFFPFSMGGFADVLVFPKFIKGRTYVTADCTGPLSGQLKSRLGQYELMMCTKKPVEAAAFHIKTLAPYTLEAKLQPGDTMEFKRSKGSTLRGLVFTHPGARPLQFKFLGKKYGLLLCIGVTLDELRFAQENGSDKLLPVLKKKGVFPYTDFTRKSVMQS